MKRKPSVRTINPVGHFIHSSLLGVILAILVPVLGYSADRLVIQDTGGETSFVVTDTGLVGIGTPTPGSPLSIVSPSAGNLFSIETTAAVGGAGFEFKVPTGGNWYFKGTMDNGFKIRDAANSKDVLYLQYGTGYIGIGTNTPFYPIQLGGGAYSNGMYWIDGSSREYKDNIRDLTAEEALKAFEGLNPVAFTLKAGAGERHVGFIAEDVPELVATKDRKGLSPMDIVAVLTKVVQEQQKTISTLKEELNELKDKVRE